MKVLTSDISLVDGKITGIVAAPDNAGDVTDQAVLVFVHGGGATAKSFDIPGQSQIERAARNGFSAYALNRPGYADSATLGFPPDSDSGVMKANAERVNSAIGELWDRHRATAPGVVIVGCSIGAAISMHVASQWSGQERPSWSLLGLAVADIAQLPQPGVVEAWHSSAVEERTDMFALQSQLAPPPLWTLAPYQFGLHSLPGILEPVLRAEGLEVSGGWLREWRRIAESISVPVHYRLGEFDSLWTAQQDLVDEFAAALRSRSPHVDAALFPGAAHGIADSIAGHEYCYGVLGFAERCAAAAGTPQLLGR
jgi:acetyl esterase/lipase